jgi:hypothetical protein
MDNCCWNFDQVSIPLLIYWYTKLDCYVDVKLEEFDVEFNAIFNSNINQHLWDPLLS